MGEYRKLFNETCEKSLEHRVYIAKERYNFLCNQISFTKVLDLFCIASAIDGSVSSRAYYFFQDVTGDKSYYDEFSSLAKNLCTPYNIQMLSDLIKSKGREVRIAAIILVILIYATNKVMTQVEEEFLDKL